MVIALSSELKPIESSKENLWKMALVQSRTLPRLNVSSSPILSTLHAPSSLLLRREIRPLTSPFSSSTAGNLPLSPLTTHPRKLLCPPPRGKFVREDYLVVLLALCFSLLFQFESYSWDGLTCSWHLFGRGNCQLKNFKSWWKERGRCRWLLISMPRGVDLVSWWHKNSKWYHPLFAHTLLTFSF